MTARDTPAAYATWTTPESQFTVSYSLPLFHEIDFLVNEGYRRIPHGGIEIGGLLFGRLDGNSLRLEAFRIIDCKHASGPSFTLSERDLALLRQQLAKSASDPGLESLEPLGWFISHTRSELRMNERESALFGELFPEPGRITVLIKPERFQPTRFGFLIRASDGRMNPDANNNAVILPLTGRSDQEPASVTIPAIPVPSRAENEAKPPIAPTAESTPAEPSGKETSNRLSIALSREALTAETHREPSPDLLGAAPESATGALVQTKPLPPLAEMKKSRPLELHRRALDPNDAQYQFRPGAEADKGLNLRLATALLFAAILGCGLGYWAYQLIAPSPIPLTVEPKSSTLLVSWPVEQTRDAGFAALKIDDGNPTPLTSQQKASGEAEINLGGDNMKVELIVQHRISDARGIVRYVRAPRLPVSQNP